MIDNFFVFRGCTWVDSFPPYFQTQYCRPDYMLTTLGFRCIYPAHHTVSKKHTLKGGPWDTNCSPTTLSYYSITFEPQRLKDIGFRCVYPLGVT